MELTSALVALNLFSKIQSLQDECPAIDFVDSMVTIDEMLEMAGAKSRRFNKSAFFALEFFGAVGINYYGDPQSAIKSIIKLIRDTPGDFRSEIYLKNILECILALVYEKVSSGTFSLEVKGAFQLAEMNGEAPNWLIYEMARYEAASGDLDAGWKRIRSLYALSPSEPEIVRLCLKFAREHYLDKEYKVVLESSKALLEAKPYLLDLAQVIHLEELEVSVSLQTLEQELCSSILLANR